MMMNVRNIDLNKKHHSINKMESNDLNIVIVIFISNTRIKEWLKH